MRIQSVKYETCITYTYRIGEIKTIEAIFKWLGELLKSQFEFTDKIFAIDNKHTIEEGNFTKTFDATEELNEIQQYCLKNDIDYITICGYYKKQMLGFSFYLKDLTIDVDLLEKEIVSIEEIEKIAGLDN